ncbi:astacin [Necator americanus]|uniref:Metalloendopeptidase n=1 Tax=Necator americanus TaxID=51031 RepID=W2T4R1_NECAM|nr:astacin [Necator americanus]ETN76863.1 astacin [Necator americanus]
MFNALHRTSYLKWDKKDSDGNFVIPYRITGLYDQSERRTIARAMKRIEDNTCIRFKPRANEWDYVDIRNQAGQGCYTNVGRPGGRSVLMLEANYAETCMETEIVLHELMHVIGLWHEHMRYDRDKYIKVHYENIERGYWSQFEKVTPDKATTYNVPYDYKSVMHYGKRSFAKPGRISMETLDSRYQNVIGNQKDASPSDYRKICEIYQCKKCMGRSTGGSGSSEVEQPEPTEAPIIVKPSPEVNGCHDLIPSFCISLIRARMIDCTFIGRIQCCATCAKIAKGRDKSPFDSIFGFFDFFNRF